MVHCASPCLTLHRRCARANRGASNPYWMEVEVTELSAFVLVIQHLGNETSKLLGMRRCSRVCIVAWQDIDPEVLFLLCKNHESIYFGFLVIQLWNAQMILYVGTHAMSVEEHLFLYVPLFQGTSNLVDPASSHTLVSKIKPCMSKYKQSIQWNCEWLIISVIVYLIVPTTWITVVILELIHA